MFDSKESVDCVNPKRLKISLKSFQSERYILDRPDLLRDKYIGLAQKALCSNEPEEAASVDVDSIEEEIFMAYFESKKPIVPVSEELAKELGQFLFRFHGEKECLRTSLLRSYYKQHSQKRNLLEEIGNKKFNSHLNHLNKYKDLHKNYEKIITKLAKTDEFRKETKMKLSLYQRYCDLVVKECYSEMVNSTYLNTVLIKDLGIFVDIITAARVQAELESPELLAKALELSNLSQPSSEELHSKLVKVIQTLCKNTKELKQNLFILHLACSLVTEHLQCSNDEPNTDSQISVQ